MGKKHRKTAPAAPPAETYSTRWKFAAILALALGAFSAIALIYRVSGPAPPDNGAASDQRFAALRAALPSRATAGYLSDIGGSSVSTSGAYYLAQYSLAPVLLEPGARHQLIVGNFSSPAAIDAALRANPVTVVTDFGNGVLLLRRNQP